MAHKQTLYKSIQQIRQKDRKMVQRVVLTGYFNEEEVKRQNLNIEQYIKQSLKRFKPVHSYLYIKGVFYIHIMESQNVNDINQYLNFYHLQLQKKPTLVNIIRVIHQSYQNSPAYLKAVDCDNNTQPGPILSETQKTQQQIQDRSFEIYDLFIDGAKKKSQNASHKIGNMIVLSNDDMSILISSNFMSLEQYNSIYIGQISVDKQQELNYPYPPSFFDVMEYLDIENYEEYKAK